VINVLLATRILVQFVGQIFAVSLLRKNAPQLDRPYRIWLYPLPSLIAVLGWLFIYLTSPGWVVGYSLGALALGIVCFLLWSRATWRWPFRATAVGND